ncbi:hypothetical protein OQA88_1391 [Cercophora sp. LCS_1]
MSGRPLPSSFDSEEEFYNEKPIRKVFRRLKEEPLVPLGALLTVWAITNATRAMRRGDHHEVQRMFRARVGAQAFTVVAMVAGGMYYSADRKATKELWKAKEVEDAEEKRRKWIRELEARDEEDKALKELIDKKRKKFEQRETGTEGVAVKARAALEASKKQEEGVLGSIGLWDKSNGESTEEGKK